MPKNFVKLQNEMKLLKPIILKWQTPGSNGKKRKELE